MKLGDMIKLHYERKSTFSDKPEVTDGEFIIIAISYGLPHCFNDDLWSQGFNSFEYGEEVENRPDVVRVGSVYVPLPSYLDKDIVKELHFDNKVVSWEILGHQARRNDLLATPPTLDTLRPSDAPNPAVQGGK